MRQVAAELCVCAVDRRQQLVAVVLRVQAGTQLATSAEVQTAWYCVTPAASSAPSVASGSGGGTGASGSSGSSG